jgi:hypothetical protein
VALCSCSCCCFVYLSHFEATENMSLIYGTISYPRMENNTEIPQKPNFDISLHPVPASLPFRIYEVPKCQDRRCDLLHFQ